MRILLPFDFYEEFHTLYASEPRGYRTALRSYVLVVGLLITSAHSSCCFGASGTDYSSPANASTNRKKMWSMFDTNFKVCLSRVFNCIVCFFLCVMYLIVKAHTDSCSVSCFKEHKGTTKYGTHPLVSLFLQSYDRQRLCSKL